jgi:branched-chain amino acid transport system permease protein
MPIVGGMTGWLGPVIGAVLLGTIQQAATVTISSAANLLIVGVLLVTFVVVAPTGILGILEKLGKKRGDDEAGSSAFDVLPLRVGKSGDK